MRYTTIDKLELVDIFGFNSLDHFLSFTTNFPALTALTLKPKWVEGKRSWISSLDDARPVLSPLRKCSFSLSNLQLHNIPPILLKPILDWVALGPSISNLRQLIIHPTESFEPVGYAIGRFLEKVRDGLTEFWLRVFVPGYSPSLAASGLETIHLDIHISEDTPHFEATLYTITYALSSITSRNLRNVTLFLKFESREFTTFDVSSAAVSDFLQANPLASVFSRDIFAEQTPVIELWIDISKQDRSTILDAAIDILPALFEPWKARGKLTVLLPLVYKKHSVAVSADGNSRAENEDNGDNGDDKHDGNDEDDEVIARNEDEDGSV
ncbi:hypothetical protein DAEQUDRAFT_764078 [Daedalea quercina L-15889]|uniref:F-box domain-containing protein n=1 Tax=Daedalea quercina L-15889 TaxID=1314783 RepID=A0A165RTT7_9APHY|nr:hypothetical protein DAEQUDRAFT_764078 [Daedalea quercina L-15889]